MKTDVSKSDFRDAFQRMNRGNQFSYDGLGVLYDWVEEFDADCENESTLDVIALCCEFCEYESLDKFHENYNKDDYPTIDDIADNTTVIPINDEAFIIQCF